MHVHVTQGEGVRFEIETRGHKVVSDQPRENNGGDQGMTPPELLLASVGSCAAYYAAEYLRTRNLADGGVEVHVTAEKLKQPARLGEFQIDVTSPVPLSPEQEQAMLRAVHHCLVHNTLLSPPQIAIALVKNQPAGV